MKFFAGLIQSNTRSGSAFGNAVMAFVCHAVPVQQPEGIMIVKAPMSCRWLAAFVLPMQAEHLVWSGSTVTD